MIYFFNLTKTMNAVKCYLILLPTWWSVHSFELEV